MAASTMILHQESLSTAISVKASITALILMPPTPQNTTTTSSTTMPQGILTTSEISLTTTYQNPREVTTFAGYGPEIFANGVGDAASIRNPTGVADANGIVYFADFNNESILE